MDYDDDAQLDTSQIEDREGRPPGRLGGAMGGFPGGKMGVGGGAAGLIMLLLAVLFGGNALTGGDGAPSGAFTEPGAEQGSQAEIEALCRSGADADAQQKCAMVADVNSIQAYWTGRFRDEGRKYAPANTVLFTGQTDSACGAAQGAMGPFYCPLDRKVYLDRSFFDELRQKFGASAGRAAQAYVLAHEYGHHVTNLNGDLERYQGDRAGPQSGSVRIELQADCFAGVWMANAVQTGYFARALNQQELNDALDAAARVGDDYIQQTFNGRVNPEKFTHGSSAQRQRWFVTGHQTGDPASCATFSGPI